MHVFLPLLSTMYTVVVATMKIDEKNVAAWVQFKIGIRMTYQHVTVT